MNGVKTRMKSETEGYENEDENADFQYMDTDNNEEQGENVTDDDTENEENSQQSVHIYWDYLSEEGAEILPG